MSKILTVFTVATSLATLGVAYNPVMTKSVNLEPQMDDCEVTTLMKERYSAMMSARTIIFCLDASDIIYTIISILKTFLFPLKKRDVDLNNPYGDTYEEWHKDGLRLMNDLKEIRKKIVKLQQKCETKSLQ